jgi:Icc protein
MLLAQLTDTHVLDPASDEPRYVDNNARLTLAVDSLNGESPAPEVVLATGDLTNDGRPGELAELVRQLARLTVPVLVLPGNHDDRASLRAAFDQPWAAADHLSWVADVGGVRIVGLDTQLPGEMGGLFDPEREAWLAETLAETRASGQATLIAMHHPPFASGLAWMDTGMLARADVFTRVVGANPQVGRILCGHLHRPVQTTVAGVATSVGLSTVHHVALDLDPGAGITMIRDPAGYQLHRYQQGQWVSHTRYIDTGEAAFTPSWAHGG